MSLPQPQGKTLPDALDYKGRPADRSKTGGWTAAAMMIGGEACERLTTVGISVDLVTYLTTTMHFGNATSANTVTNFIGASLMLCLLGGFVADTFFGRYLTIAIFAIVQAMGVIIFTISTTIPSLRPPKCDYPDESCIPASGTQLMVLYLGLYVTALGSGGVKSSVSGFGSDQFDDSNKEEKLQMTKFFNWFLFFINIGSLVAVTFLVYIQDRLGREWGYGICACSIVISLIVFLLGTKRYRFKKLVGSPLTQIAAVFVAAWKKRRLELSSVLFNVDDPEIEEDSKRKQKLPHSRRFRYLDKAAIKDRETSVTEKRNLVTLTNVEEVKMVIQMLPIWATTIMFWTVYAQMTTFLVSQASTMDRHMGPSFQIPAASLTMFSVGSIFLTVLVYDRTINPFVRKILKNPQAGLTPLQQIGVGLVFSILAMVAAALTELKRLRVARSHGLTDNPTAEIPLSVFWLVPQFFLLGSGTAFTYSGKLDFFLRECPEGMKTMSTGLFLSSISVGFFLSSLLVTIVHKLTRNNKPWLADNINQGRLYDFYWLLTILSGLNVILYLVCTKSYVYKEKRLAEEGGDLEEAGLSSH